MVLQEFQAIIFAAGRGTRLPELTGDHPKCLLPIGPFPLLWYPLNMLQQHNFQDVIVIVLESQKSEIQQAIERTTLKMKIDFVTIPTDSDFGTADSLRYIHDKIKTDFIVVPCDVVTNVSLYPMINKFRQHNATLVTLLFSGGGGFDGSVIVPGPKSKQKPERDLIGIHPDSNRLLLLASTSDFEETMSVNAHLLRKNGKMQIFSRLIDSHIYIMQKWVLEFLQKKETFSTLKGEFIPYIIKKQIHNNIQPSLDATSEAGVNLKTDDDIFHHLPIRSLDQQIIKTSLYNDSRFKDPYNGDLLRCYAVEAPKSSVGFRANTTLSYFAANQKISTLWPQLFEENSTYSLIATSAVVNSTQIKDIAVADNANLSEKTSLSSSTFGPYCQVNPKNIIVNSIIMGYATIEEGCNIENSIICNRAVIKKGCKLKSCMIGPNYILEENSIKEMVHLTNADGFMEIE